VVHSSTGWEGVWTHVSLSHRVHIESLRKALESCNCKPDFPMLTKQQLYSFTSAFQSHCFILFFSLVERITIRGTVTVIKWNGINLRCVKQTIKLHGQSYTFLLFHHIWTFSKHPPWKKHNFFSRGKVQSLGTVPMKFHANHPLVFYSKYLQNLDNHPSDKGTGRDRNLGIPLRGLFWLSTLENST